MLATDAFLKDYNGAIDLDIEGLETDEMNSAGQLLEEWLKEEVGSLRSRSTVALDEQGQHPDTGQDRGPRRASSRLIATQADVASALDISISSLYRLKKGKGNLTVEQLRLLRRSIQHTIPNPSAGLRLVDELLRDRGVAPLDPVSNFPGPLRQDKPVISPGEITSSLARGLVADDYLAEAAKCMGALFDQGDVATALRVAEEMWWHIEERSKDLNHDLLEVGLLYARLLGVTARFDESLEVGRRCEQFARGNESRRHLAFAHHGLMSTLERRSLSLGQFSVNDRIVEGYQSAEAVLQDGTGGSKHHRDLLRWPINHNHRAVISYVTNLVDPHQMSPNTSSLLKRYAVRLCESRKAVAEKPSWDIANDIVTLRLVAVIGDPESALGQAEELLRRKPHRWDHQHIDLTRVLALRTLGTSETTEEARHILMNLEAENRGLGHNNRLLFLRRLRRAVEQSGR